MKRLGGLKQQIAAGVTKLTIDGATPQQQLTECNTVITAFQQAVHEIYQSLVIELAQHKIVVKNYGDLASQDHTIIKKYFNENVLPLITPLAIDTTHPFPFISNLSLNLLVTLQYPGSNKPLIARIKIPRSKEVPRFVRLGDSYHFVLIEDIIINNLGLVFPELDIQNCTTFRIIRNAAAADDDKDQEYLMEMIESTLHDRKFAPVVKLEVGTSVKTSEIALLTNALSLDKNEDVFECKNRVGLSDLMELARLDIPRFHDIPHQAVDNSKLDNEDNIFESISNSGTILLQHPYESFETSVERFAQEASIDPKVVAIKKTLYRTSSDTKIVEYLINAAQRGKHVVVIVELQARFDEAANIKWTNRLKNAGIHVKHGVPGLKTHCKTILVVRRENKELCRYAHISTGNYHAGTARLYSDVGILTNDKNLTKDLTTLFNHLTTSWNILRHYSRIVTAPHLIKSALLMKINREIGLHSSESPGLIRLKTNALEDVDISAALYRASQAGVTVQLIVRDICRLRPGIPGLSENINVISIVGRFLEHSRIYYFRNGGEEEFYIGSADLMRRNLERRVEVIVPVENVDTKQLLQNILEEELLDQRSAWEMDSAGNYTQRRISHANISSNCQDAATQAAIQRIANKSLRMGAKLSRPVGYHH